MALPQANASASSLAPHRRRWHILLADLHTLSSWQNKLRLLRGHLFPPATYLYARYATTNCALLPVFYAHRAVRGVWRLWQRLECARSNL